jgi:hypothetical protein
MTLAFLRWPSHLNRRNESTNMVVARLTRLTPEARRIDVVDYSPAPCVQFEPPPEPLYESSVYHSHLEELPTFAMTLLSEAAEH